MAMKAYEEFAEPLAFPIRGKTYVVPDIGYQEGIRLQRIFAGDADDDLLLADAEASWRFVLGPVYDEMIADNVPMQAIVRAGFAAMADLRWGRDAAETAWESGLDPEVLAAAMTAAAQKKAVAVAESTTKKPASGTTTRPRRKATAKVAKSVSPR